MDRFKRGVEGLLTVGMGESWIKVILSFGRNKGLFGKKIKNVALNPIDEQRNSRGGGSSQKMTIPNVPW